MIKTWLLHLTNIRDDSIIVFSTLANKKSTIPSKRVLEIAQCDSFYMTKNTQEGNSVLAKYAIYSQESKKGNVVLCIQLIDPSPLD